jgi:hypothetical protein
MNSRQFPTICGLWCDDCIHFEKDCQGCSDTDGCAFWAEYVDVEACPAYVCCVEEKHLPHCGYCDKMPCELHTRFHDPDMSEEEREEGLKKQIEELRRRREEEETDPDYPQ